MIRDFRAGLVALLLLIAAVVLFRVVRRRAQESDIEADGPEAGQS
jgi:hypothetical protein